ncbi:hypothetical protein I4U23_027724 [Adineta vaga]|nr:hypothetical protein I4U23_027724 [Adineta vaga]
MIIKETIAGDCDGTHCGCYNEYCWSYIKERHNSDGISWCYTQNTAINTRHQEWQPCTNNHDCYSNRPCINFIRSKTEDEENKSSNDWDLFQWLDII